MKLIAQIAVGVALAGALTAGAVFIARKVTKRA